MNFFSGIGIIAAFPLMVLMADLGALMLSKVRETLENPG